MTIDFWIALWTLLLWSSMGAFGLLGIYILAGLIHGLGRE